MRGIGRIGGAVVLALLAQGGAAFPQGKLAPPSPAAPKPADPAFEAARAAFEPLPEAERKALQDALVWTGDFNGVTSAASAAAPSRRSRPSQPAPASPIPQAPGQGGDPPSGRDGPQGRALSASRPIL